MFAALINQFYSAVLFSILLHTLHFYSPASAWPFLYFCFVLHSITHSLVFRIGSYWWLYLSNSPLCHLASHILLWSLLGWSSFEKSLLCLWGEIMCLLPWGLKFAFSMPLLLKEAANTPLTYVLDPVTLLNRKCVGALSGIPRFSNSCCSICCFYNSI